MISQFQDAHVLFQYKQKETENITKLDYKWAYLFSAFFEIFLRVWYEYFR